MALPKHTYQVAGFTYTTPLMTASASLAMLPRIVCLLGQEVTQLVLGTAPTGLETMLANHEVVGAMLHTISTNAVAQGDGLLLLRDLLACTTVKLDVGDDVGDVRLADVYVFDEHFAGRLGDLLLVAMHAARASFMKPSQA